MFHERDNKYNNGTSSGPNSRNQAMSKHETIQKKMQADYFQKVWRMEVFLSRDKSAEIFCYILKNLTVNVTSRISISFLLELVMENGVRIISFYFFPFEHVYIFWMED